MLPTVRESYEGQYILGLEAIYRLLNMVFVGHVVCPVTSASSQKMATVLGASYMKTPGKNKKIYFALAYKLLITNYPCILLPFRLGWAICSSSAALASMSLMISSTDLLLSAAGGS